jgi:hypothetical protein
LISFSALVGVEMIRTIWLAAFFLAGICGLCATKVTASISPPEEGVPDRTTVSFVTDTLNKADRLDVSKLAGEPEATFALPPDPIIVLASKSLVSSGSPQRQSNPRAGRTAVLLPRPRPKVQPLQTSKER